MKKIDTQSKLDFDRSIGTEDRFAIRGWFERLVARLNQTNPQLWKEGLGEGLIVSGLTPKVMDRKNFLLFLGSQFQLGDYTVRYPLLKVQFRNGSFRFRGTFESFTNGILTCSGDVTLTVVKQEDGFYLTTHIVDPTFRVVQ